MGVRQFGQTCAPVATATAVVPTLADDVQFPAAFRAQEIQSDGRSLDSSGRLRQVRLTVSGDWHIGHSEHVDKNAAQTLGSGGFYTKPAGQPHFASTNDLPAVVHITGQGPTDTSYVHRAEPPSGN